MKRLALLAIALLASCASSDGLIDEQLRDCGPGGDISVIAGFDNMPAGESVNEDRFDLLIEVSNNSHGEVTVKSVRLEQQHPEMASYRIQNVWRTFDQVIEEGKDETFRLPVVGRRAISRDSRDAMFGSRGLELAVTVTLSNGDSYRCLFAQGVP